MSVERKPAFLEESPEAGVMVIRALVEALRQQILREIVLSFFCVRQIAVARVEALRQEQEAADAVPELLEFARMSKLISVTVEMVRPDVLDFVALAPALRILGIPRCVAGAGFDLFRHSRKQTMDLWTIHAVKPEAAISAVARKRLRLVVQALAQKSDELGCALAANVAHHQEHRVLDRRVVDCAPVPDAAVDEDVEKSCADADLPQHAGLIIFDAKRREQDRILQREIVLCIEVNGFETRCERIGGTAETLIPAGVEREVSLDEARELGARSQA
jgi:hypothetical protein